MFINITLWENICLWLISIDLLDDLSVALFNFVNMSVVFNQFVDHVFLRVTWSLLQTRLDLSIWRPVKSCVVNVWKECGFYSLKSYCFYIPSICINYPKKFCACTFTSTLFTSKLHELSPISKILNCVYYRCMLLSHYLL